MKLAYRVLWFEDQEDIVTDLIGPQIRHFLDDLGFDFEYTHEKNGERLEELIHLRNYDLVLTDLNLGEYDTGERIIHKIRDFQIYTEVLLYSSNAERIDQITSENKWVERVSFSAGIRNLSEKIIRIIDLSIKKVQEVNNIRGLVMAETSEIDHKMQDIIISFLQRSHNHDMRFDELRDKVAKKRQDKLNELLDISSNNFMNIFKHLDTQNKLDAIRRLANHFHQDEKSKVFESLLHIVKEYENEVMHKRNALAHAREVVNNLGETKVVSMINNEEISFDEESCKQLRRNIRKHSRNFDEFLYVISGFVRDAPTYINTPSTGAQNMGM